MDESCIWCSLLTSTALFWLLLALIVASTDSYNLIAKLASACQVVEKCAVISLLQPSDDIVALFDKLLVISDDGELSYFGPVDRQVLRQVFLGPDADPSRDSGSISDLVLQRSNDPIGSTSKDRYRSTAAHQDMVLTLEEIRAMAPKGLERNLKRYLPPNKYPSPWRKQMSILARRRIKLIARNAVTYTRVCIAAVFATVIGSLFSILKNDLIGSLGRTGYMFLNCFLVLMLSAAITIPQTFRDRVTLFKHRSAEFYSGRIAYITQMLLDIPLSVLEAIVLSSISYYWVDMKEGGDHFLYFMGTLIGLEFAGQAFGRLLCAVSRKQVSANSLSSVGILFFGTVAGFMPNYSQIPAVFRWLSWITPASYAFEGIMLNEFAGRAISAVVLASPDGNVEIGTFDGEIWLSIFALPRTEWGSLDDIKLFNIFFLFILSIAFDILGCYYVENTREWFFNQTRRPLRTTKSLDFALLEETVAKTDVLAGGQEEPVDTVAKESDNHWPQSLSFNDLSYYVPIKRKGGPKRLSLESIIGPLLVRLARKKRGDISGSLHDTDGSELQLLGNVHGRFRSGRMTALMGTR